MINEETYGVDIQLWTLDTDTRSRSLVDNFILSIEPRDVSRGPTYVESVGHLRQK